MSYLFVRSESHRLIDIPYPTKMRSYKILARTFLAISIINFALAAPVAVKKYEVRVKGVDVAKDGTTTSPPRRDSSTNALPTPRSSDPGYWQEQERRQLDLASRTDSDGSPEPGEPSKQPIDLFPNPPSPSLRLGPGSTSQSPTDQAPTDKPDPLNQAPSSLHGNTDLTYLNSSLYQGQD